MLYNALTRLTADECLSYGGEVVTYAALKHAADQLVETLRPLAGRKTALHLPDSPRLVAVLLALDRLGVDAYLIGGETAANELLKDFGLEACVTEAEIRIPATVARGDRSPKLPGA